MVSRLLCLSLAICVSVLAGCEKPPPANLSLEDSPLEQNTTSIPEQSPEPTPQKEGSVFEKAATGDIHATRYLLYQNRLEKDEVKLVEIRKAILESAESGNHEAQLELGKLLQDRKTAWDDPAQAMAKFEKNAANGDPDAALFLHYFYKSGIGAQADEEKSLSWLKKSVNENHPVAQYILVKNYFYENDIENNLDAAKELLIKSAKQNFSASQALLAKHYINGFYEAIPDYKTALQWALKADENNNPEGSIELGRLYERGWGVSKSKIKSKKLYEKALNQGIGLAYVRMSGWHYANQDFHKSLEYAKKGFEHGDPRSAAAMSLHFVHGSGVEQNYAEAKKFAAIAADKNDSFGQYILGSLYFHGFGEKKDKKIAYEWFKKSSQGNDPESLNLLGLYYTEGYPPAKIDFKKAKYYFEKASAFGSDNAKSNLGRIYLWGLGADKDVQRGIKLLEETAQKGLEHSFRLLGFAYLEGQGVVKNHAEALVNFYLSKAYGGSGNEKNIADLEGRLTPKSVVLCQQKAEQIFLRQKYEREQEFGEDEASRGPQSGESVSKLPEPAGSGILISKDGLVVTAYHVIETAKRVAVKTSKGVFNVKLLAADKPNDLALLQIKDSEGELTAAPLAPSAKVKLGQTVFTLGFPNSALQGFNVKMTKGEISSTTGIQDDPRQFQISVPVQPGNSGGALFDEQGNVVGIVVAKLNEKVTEKITGNSPQNVNYAVKSSYVFPLVEQTQSNPLAPHEQSPPPKLEQTVERVQDACVMVLVEE